MCVCMYMCVDLFVCLRLRCCLESTLVKTEKVYLTSIVSNMEGILGLPTGEYYCNDSGRCSIWRVSGHYDLVRH